MQCSLIHVCSLRDLGWIGRQKSRSGHFLGQEISPWILWKRCWCTVRAPNARQRDESHKTLLEARFQRKSKLLTKNSFDLILTTGDIWSILSSLSNSRNPVQAYKNISFANTGFVPGSFASNAKGWPEKNTNTFPWSRCP